MRRRRSPAYVFGILALSALLTACGTSSASSASAAPSFKGKTVAIIDNFSAGGTNDLLQRLIAKYLPQYLPGHPTVIVKDMPGAGGDIGTNYVYRSKPDGLTLGGLSDPTWPYLLKNSGVHYKLDGFNWIGAVADSNVIYVAKSTGVTNVSGLMHSNAKWVFGGLSPSSSFDLGMRAILGTLGVKYKYVTGYPGPSQEIQAFRSGEDNIELEGASGYEALIAPMVQENLATPVVQEGIWNAQGKDAADPAVAQLNLPTVWDAVTSALGHTPSGSYANLLKWVLQSNNLTRAEVLPPGTPAPIVSAYRTAFSKVMTSSAFMAAAKKELGGAPSYNSGDKVLPIIKSLSTALSSHPKTASLLATLSKNK